MSYELFIFKKLSNQLLNCYFVELLIDHIHSLIHYSQFMKRCGRLDHTVSLMQKDEWRMLIAEIQYLNPET